MKESLDRDVRRKVIAVTLGLACLSAGICWCQDTSSQRASLCVPAANLNLVKNGDFGKLLESWLTVGRGTNSYHPEDPGRAEFKVENGVLRVTIGDQGISIWSIMVYQSVVFEKGATYVVSFRARSDSDRRITSSVTQDETWTNFSGDRTFDLTKSMKDYSYEFTMGEQGPALVQFCLGKAGIGSVYLSKVAVTKKI
jgi:hypothetical protein